MFSFLLIYPHIAASISSLQIAHFENHFLVRKQLLGYLIHPQFSLTEI
ncbi:hypothetical protein NT04LM_3845, partial [Listeria monocytogenes FSL F2-208]